MPGTLAQAPTPAASTPRSRPAACRRNVGSKARATGAFFAYTRLSMPIQGRDLKEYYVFLASPGDVQDERKAVRAFFESFNNIGLFISLQ